MKETASCCLSFHLLVNFCLFLQLNLVRDFSGIPICRTEKFNIKFGYGELSASFCLSFFYSFNFFLFLQLDLVRYLRNHYSKDFEIWYKHGYDLLYCVVRLILLLLVIPFVCLFSLFCHIILVRFLRNQFSFGFEI